MATKLYPPLIESSIPAFYKQYNASTKKPEKAEITIPFEINRTVSRSEFSHIRLRLRTIATNTELANILSKSIEIIDIKNCVATFVLNPGEAAKFNEGQFYMAQIAFVSADNITNANGLSQTDANDPSLVGYYSNLATIKCVSKPTLSIPKFFLDRTNTLGQEIVGLYVQDTTYGDSTEKVDTYRFQIWDDSENVILDSGELLHNSNEDTSNFQSNDRFLINHILQEGQLYYVQYSVTTINKLSLSSPIYLVTEGISVDIEANVKFHGESSFEEGYVKLWLQGEMLGGTAGEPYHEEIITGTFLITRASDRDHYLIWDEIVRFNITGGYPSEYIFRDFTVEQGVPYKYRIQQYNQKDIRSNPIYLSYSREDELNGLGKNGETKIIIPDFEDMFLYDGKRQLKIRFNPKISSFKNNIPEQKIETIGSKYPFIFRNGQVCYKEFPISGLLSFQTDNTISFFTMEEAEIAGILSPIYARGRADSTIGDALINDSSGHFKGIQGDSIVEYPAGMFIKKEHEYTWVSGSGYTDPEYVEVRQNKDLTSENIMGERYFKLAVLNWLSDGEVKLFRSPTEGNYLVRLMNVSLTPQDALGRMIHTFNCTAYEIADLTYDNFLYYKIITKSSPNLIERQWASIDLNQVIFKDQDGHVDLPEDQLTPNYEKWYSLTLNSNEIDEVEFSDFAPNDKIRLKFSNSSDDEWEYIVIGATGGYNYQSRSRYIVGIEFLPTDISYPTQFSRIITYTYEKTQSRKFDAVTEITTTPQIVIPYIGPIDNLLNNYELYNRTEVILDDNYTLIDKDNEEYTPGRQYQVKTINGWALATVPIVDHYITRNIRDYYAYGENMHWKLSDFDPDNTLVTEFSFKVGDEAADAQLYGSYVTSFENAEGNLISIWDPNQYATANEIQTHNVDVFLTFFNEVPSSLFTIIPDDYRYSNQDFIIRKNPNIVQAIYNPYIAVGVREIEIIDQRTGKTSYEYPWSNGNNKYYYCKKQDLFDAFIENKIIPYYTNNPVILDHINSAPTAAEKLYWRQQINILINQKTEALRNILFDTSTNALSHLTSDAEIIGKYPLFDPATDYYISNPTIALKKVAKSPSTVQKVIPYTINYNLSPTVTKYSLVNLNVLHVRKRDVVPIYALDGEVEFDGEKYTFLPTINSSYCMTPFFNGYVNQTVPYNLINNPASINDPKTIAVDNQIQYETTKRMVTVDDEMRLEFKKEIIALNTNDIWLLPNVKANISKHSILQVYRPVLTVQQNTEEVKEIMTKQQIKNFENFFVAIDWEPVPIDSGFAYYDTNSLAFFEPGVDYEPYFAINNLEDNEVVVSRSFIENEDIQGIQFKNQNLEYAFNEYDRIVADLFTYPKGSDGFNHTLALANAKANTICIDWNIEGHLDLENNLITFPPTTRLNAHEAHIIHYTNAQNTNLISLKETEEITLKHLGQPDMLFLGNGVMAELTYELRETSFAIEEEVPAVAAAKAAYELIKEQYYKSLETYYSLYYSLLDAQFNIDGYTNKIQELKQELLVYLQKVQDINELLEKTSNPQLFKEQIVNSQNTLLEDIKTTLSIPNVYGQQQNNTYNAQRIATQQGTTIGMIDFVAACLILGITPDDYDPDLIRNSTAIFISSYSLKEQRGFLYHFGRAGHALPTTEQFRTYYTAIQGTLNYYEFLGFTGNNSIASFDTRIKGYWPFTLLLEKKVISDNDQSLWYCYPSYGNQERFITDPDKDTSWTDDTIYNEYVVGSQQSMFNSLYQICRSYIEGRIVGQDALYAEWNKSKNRMAATLSSRWDDTLLYRIYASMHPTSVDVIAFDPGYAYQFAHIIRSLSTNLQQNYYKNVSQTESTTEMAYPTLLEDWYSISPSLSEIVGSYNGDISSELVIELIEQKADTFVAPLFAKAIAYRQQYENGTITDIQTLINSMNSDIITATSSDTINSNANSNIYPRLRSNSTNNVWVSFVDADITADQSESFRALFGYRSNRSSYCRRLLDYISLDAFTTKMRLFIQLLKTEKKYPVQDDKGRITYTLIPIKNNEILIEDLQLWLKTLIYDKFIAAYAYWHKANNMSLDENNIQNITQDYFSLYFYPDSDITYQLKTALTASTATSLMNTVNQTLEKAFGFSNLTLQYTANALPASASSSTIYFQLKQSEKEYIGYRYTNEKWSQLCRIPQSEIVNTSCLNTSDLNYKTVLINSDPALDGKDTLRISRLQEIEKKTSINLQEYIEDYYQVRTWIINNPSNNNNKILLSKIQALIKVREALLINDIYNKQFFNNSLWEEYIGTLTTARDSLLIDFASFIEDAIDYNIKNQSYATQLAQYNALALDENSVVGQFESINKRLQAQQATVQQWQAVQDSCELMLETNAYNGDAQEKARLEDTLATAKYKLIYEQLVLSKIEEELNNFKKTDAYIAYLAEKLKLDVAERETKIAYILLYGTEDFKMTYGLNPEDIDYIAIYFKRDLSEDPVIGTINTYKTSYTNYMSLVNKYLKLMTDLHNTTTNKITSLGLHSLIDYQSEILSETNTVINIQTLENKLTIYEQGNEEMQKDVQDIANMIQDFVNLFKNLEEMIQKLENLLKYYDGDPVTLSTGLIQETRNEIKKYESLEKEARTLINKYGDNFRESIDEQKLQDALNEALSTYLTLLQQYYISVVEERYGE